MNAVALEAVAARRLRAARRARIVDRLAVIDARQPYSDGDVERRDVLRVRVTKARGRQQRDHRRRQPGAAAGRDCRDRAGPREKTHSRSILIGLTLRLPSTRFLHMPETLFHKVWNAHTVRTLTSGQTQLFIGLHLVHEVTSPQAFDMLRQHGWKVAFPERTFATV